jgi:hypothetical protein
MKTGEWNETFNFDEEEAELTTVYENTDNIMMDSLSTAGESLTSVFVLSCAKRKIIIKSVHVSRKKVLLVFYLNIYILLQSVI